MTIQRPRFSNALWLALALGLFGTATQSSAAQVLKFGHIMSPKHQVQITAQKFADEVKTRTGGAIEVQIFPSGQLGQEKEMFESMRLGTLEMGFIPGNAIEAFEPSAGLFSLPYLFKSNDHVFAVQDGAPGKEIVRRVLEKTGVRYLSYGIIGFRHTLTRNKVIRTVDDFAGLKIRVPPSPAFVNAFKLLGANPTPIPGGEMYTALQTGVVDGVEGAPDILNDFKMFETAKNYSLTRHIFTDINIVIAERTWKSISPAHQKALAEAARAAELYQRDLLRKSEDSMFESLRANGVGIISVDTAPMRAKMAPFYAEFAKRIGGSALIDQAAAVAK